MQTWAFRLVSSHKVIVALVVIAYIAALAAVSAMFWNAIGPWLLNGNPLASALTIVAALLPMFALVILLDSHRTLALTDEAIVVSDRRGEISRLSLDDVGSADVAGLSRHLEIRDRAKHVWVSFTCAGITNPSDKVLDALLRKVPGTETRTEGSVERLTWTDRHVEFVHL